MQIARQRSLKRSHSGWRCPEQIRPGDPVVLRHPHAPWPIVVSEDSEEEERPTTTETSSSLERKGSRGKPKREV